MGTYMNDDICAPYILEIAISSHILMGRRHIGIMKDLADPAVTSRPGAAPFRLNTDHGITVFNPCNQNPTIIYHSCGNTVYFLARRIPPGPGHPVSYLFRKRVKPLSVLINRNICENAPFFDDLIHSSPSEFRDSFSLHNRIDKLLAVFRRINRISRLFHSGHYHGSAFKGVKMRTAADRGLNRSTGIVVQDKRDLSLCRRFLL